MGVPHRKDVTLSLPSKWMRRRLALGLFTCLLTCLLAACAGADSQDVLGDTPSGATTTTPTTTTPTGATTTPAPAPSVPFASCGPEKEPNDDTAHATQVNGAVCGTITSDTDVDFLTFKLKGGTKRMSLKFDGKVTLKLTVGSKSVTLGNGSNPEIPFSKTDDYVIEVRGIDKGAMPTWRVEVVES